MRSWLSNGLNERVLAHVMEITKSADVPLSEFEMFVTGMSFGNIKIRGDKACGSHIGSVPSSLLMARRHIVIYWL